MRHLDRSRSRTPAPSRSRGGVLLFLIAIGMLAALLLFGSTLLERLHRGPRPETVVTTSLMAVRQQAVITPFTATFITAPTSTTTRLLGMAETKRTTIMPATVNYEVDLSSLRREDVRWDAATATLLVTLPPLRISRPAFDLSRRQIYEDGQLLGVLTGDNNRLDAANNAQAERDVLAQARSGVPMRLARDAATRVVGQMFEVPLKAAGLDARVEVRFADATLPAR